jgi:ribosomal protein S18 acetylase RimI-like enzyme
METISHTIRKAEPADAQALAALAERTFRDAFSTQNSAEDMDAHCRRSYAEAIQASEIENQRVITLLAEERSVLVGYAQARLSPSAPGGVKGGAPGEIQRLYVSSENHGRGIAQALMNASISALKAHGCDVAWLGVWERNPRAIAFYRKSGFEEVGEHVFLLGSDPQRDVIMALPLASSGDAT